ncbi:hypothetical protein PM082_008951 [Marasmius tenuissimus]|nr:hypothetical protein PM082_008951 [Marasmius tenuissimus]
MTSGSQKTTHSSSTIHTHGLVTLTLTIRLSMMKKKEVLGSSSTLKVTTTLPKMHEISKTTKQPIHGYVPSTVPPSLDFRSPISTERCIKTFASQD